MSTNRVSLTSAHPDDPSFKDVSGAAHHEQQFDVADHPSAARWLKELARRDTDGYLRLVGDNERRLEALYGRPKWQSKGEHGWRLGWTFVDEGLSWVVLSGPQGTIFRLRVPSDGDDYLNDPRVGIGITAFLQRLTTQMFNSP